MNGPGVREAKIETAICQYVTGWLIGKPQVSTTKCPASFLYKTEIAIETSLGTGHSSVQWERLSMHPKCVSVAGMMLLRVQGDISVLRTTILSWSDKQKSPHGREKTWGRFIRVVSTCLGRRAQLQSLQ